MTFNKDVASEYSLSFLPWAVSAPIVMLFVLWLIDYCHKRRRGLMKGHHLRTMLDVNTEIKGDAGNLVFGMVFVSARDFVRHDCLLSYEKLRDIGEIKVRSGRRLLSHVCALLFAAKVAPHEVCIWCMFFADARHSPGRTRMGPEEESHRLLGAVA